MARPSLIPPNLGGNLYSTVQIVQFLNQTCQFSMYWQAVGGVSAPNVPNDMADIATNWLNTVRPLLRACLSLGTSLVEYRVWSLTWPNIATGIYSTGNQLGTRAGDPLPPQIALVITKKTNLRGKSGRGRMYLCGMSEDDSTNGRPTNALLTAVGLLCQNLINPFVGAASGVTFNPIVVSLIGYQKAAVSPGPVVVPNPPPIINVPGGVIQSMFPDDIWYTQRRRTIGFGR